MRICLAIYFSLSALLLCGQVEVKDTIRFTGQSNAERTISGLDLPIDSSSAVNASSIISSSVQYATVTMNGDSLDLSLSPGITNYKTGLSISFISPMTNTDSLYLSIDGLPYRKIMRSATVNLDSADLVPGLAVEVIYDGQNFILISEVSKSCPNGFVPVNDRFCIQEVERDSATFWQAIVDCGDKDGRLCTWSEWYLACAKLGASLTDMNNNWEFIDSGQNFVSTFQSGAAAKLIGEGVCETSGRTNPDNPRAYRCCYTR